MWFRQLALFRLPQDARLDLEALASGMEQHVFALPGGLEWSSQGFVAPAFVERLLADNQRLRETARRLVDVMERSDLEQFENAQPVSGEEWFDAIREAKGMLA